jgi:hypothetical protein
VVTLIQMTTKFKVGDVILPLPSSKNYAITSLKNGGYGIVTDINPSGDIWVDWIGGKSEYSRPPYCVDPTHFRLKIDYAFKGKDYYS